MTLFHAARLNWSMRPPSKLPALLTRMSTVPIPLHRRLEELFDGRFLADVDGTIEHVGPRGPQGVGGGGQLGGISGTQREPAPPRPKTAGRSPCRSPGFPR